MTDQMPPNRPRPWPRQVRDAMPVLEDVARKLGTDLVIDTGCKALDDALDGVFENNFSGGYSAGQASLLDELIEEHDRLFGEKQDEDAAIAFYRFLTSRDPEKPEMERITLYRVGGVGGGIYDDREMADAVARDPEELPVEELEAVIVRRRKVKAPEAEEWRVVFQVHDGHGVFIRDLTDARVFKSFDDAHAYGEKGVAASKTVTTSAAHHRLKLGGYRVHLDEALALTDFMA